MSALLHSVIFLSLYCRRFERLPPSLLSGDADFKAVVQKMVVLLNGKNEEVEQFQSTLQQFSSELGESVVSHCMSCCVFSSGVL